MIDINNIIKIKDNLIFSFENQERKRTGIENLMTTLMRFLLSI